MKVLIFDTKQEFDNWKVTEKNYYEYRTTTTGKVYVILWGGHK